jgi:SAM-dependent methyltransferase
VYPTQSRANDLLYDSTDDIIAHDNPATIARAYYNVSADFMARIRPFDVYSRRYEDWFIRNEFAYKSEIQAIRQLLPQHKKGIEIGVGSGRFAAPFGIKLGVEPSRMMRKIAQKRGIEVIDAVAENLPLENSLFHFVLMVTTICFLDNIEIAFREVYRVLKSHGHFIVGFVDKNSRLGKMYQRHKNMSVFYEIATFYSVDEVVAHLSKTGFKDFVFTQTIFHDLADIKAIEPVKEDYGQGAFVVVKAIK